MSLFDKLKDTKLKSLKFSSDKPGGGTSLEPVIQKPILDNNLVGQERSFNDVAEENRARIAKILKSTPRGTRFVRNQTGLQISNAHLETSNAPILNTINLGGGFIGAINKGINFINNANSNFNSTTAAQTTRLTPLHAYSSEVTLAQLESGEGTHLDRFGLTPYIEDRYKYINIANANNTTKDNRLTKLRTKLNVGYTPPNPFNPITSTPADQVKNKILGQIKNTLSGISSFTNLVAGISNIFGGSPFLNKLNNTVNNVTKVASPFLVDQLDQYIGGPGSRFGIGATSIRRVDFTNKLDKFNALQERSNVNAKKAYILNIEGRYGTDALFLAPNSIKTTFNADNLKISLNKSKTKTDSVQNIKIEPTSKVYPPSNSKLGNQSNPVDSKLDAVLRSAFGTPVNVKIPINGETGAINTNLTLVTSNKAYNALKTKPTNITTPKTYQYDSISDQPTTVSHTLKTKQIGSLINRTDANFEYLKNALNTVYDRKDDKIMSVSFNQLNPFTGKGLANSTFSAYISGYSEDYNSNWTDIKYNGRSEFFYTFNSFKKTASFKLQIPIFNQWELTEKHDALKKLQKSSAGAYQDNRLGGVISTIKLGYYLNYAPCIITNLKITIPNESSWDWGIDNLDGDNLAYAMLLEADFSITVIGNEIPGWNLGNTPSPPPIKPEPIPVPKVEPVKMQMPAIKKIVPDTTSAGTTRGPETFRGTSLATATNAIKLKTLPPTVGNAKQKAKADALIKKVK
jgi:hypothetical protein